MQRRPITLVYFITPHGFGHATRSIEILRKVLKRAPGSRAAVVSAIPRRLLGEGGVEDVLFRERRLDIGLIQKDDLEFDLSASLEALLALKADSRRILEEESDFLHSFGADIAVCDIPFIPFAAANRAGVPVVGVSNLTWDWIYEAYRHHHPAWEAVIAWVRQCYGLGEGLLRLPMHGDASAFRRVEDVPLAVRRARKPREVARAALGIPEGWRACLISFAHLALDGEARSRLEALPRTLFFHRKALSLDIGNSRLLEGTGVDHVDAVAAMDAVVTKPGYGVSSECIAHGVPMLYTDRGDFPEYPVLVEVLKSHIPCAHIPSDELRAGLWGPYLDALRSMERPDRVMGLDGADVCAERILDFAANGRMS